MAPEMEMEHLVASGEGIDCYHLGAYTFVAYDTESGLSYEGRSMQAAISAALQARDLACRLRHLCSMFGEGRN